MFANVNDGFVYQDAQNENHRPADDVPVMMRLEGFLRPNRRIQNLNAHGESLASNACVVAYKTGARLEPVSLQKTMSGFAFSVHLFSGCKTWMT
jgi:hypothetical protein